MTSREEYADRQYVKMYCHHIRHADCNKSLENSLRSCWFLCRYGMQDYKDVITWPHSELRRAMDALSYWIEKESPKTRAGPS